MSASISGPNVVDICICLSSYNDNYYFYYKLKKGYYVTTIYHYQIISVNFKLNVTKKKTHTTHREVKYLQQNTSKQANPPSKKKKKYHHF